MASGRRSVSSYAAFIFGTVLLCWTLALLAFGGQSDAVQPRRAEAAGEPAPAPAAEPKLVYAQPDPNGSGKVDMVYQRPDGTFVHSKEGAEHWREEEKEKEEKMYKKNHHPFLLVSLVIWCLQIAFACMYKQKVVDLIPSLEQRPISTLEDFQQDIFACCSEQHLCLHAGFCCQCRAAHTWHVAGICEYWPALGLLFLGHVAKIACCVDAIIYTYFRMKLKEKLGIRPNPCMDLAYSVFCPCCAVGQEAMAVDQELGTQVDCVFQLRGPAAIGSMNTMDRDNVVQLVNPNSQITADAGEDAGE